MDKIRLRLFVTGKSPRSETAIKNLNILFKHEYNIQFELKVIDVLEQPHLAEKANIIATPTLIKDLPLPKKRIIGDFANMEEVLTMLNIKELLVSYTKK